MNDIEELYFEWLLIQLDQRGVKEGVAHLCGLLHDFEFLRRVGLDVNRASDGANLRKEFLEAFHELEYDAHITNAFMLTECSWLEMLIALARRLDYLYEGGVEGRFLEMIGNMGLTSIAEYNPDRSESTEEYDEGFVETTTHNINSNLIDRDGRGGLFPLRKQNHRDQRKIEIWEQQAAYFNEKFEGVLWTSTS